MLLILRLGSTWVSMPGSPAPHCVDNLVSSLTYLLVQESIESELGPCSCPAWPDIRRVSAARIYSGATEQSVFTTYTQPSETHRKILVTHVVSAVPGRV